MVYLWLIGGIIALHAGFVAILAVGFISYYLKLWPRINLPAKFFTVAAYVLAGVHLLLVLDWLRPFFRKHLRTYFLE